MRHIVRRTGRVGAKVRCGSWKAHCHVGAFCCTALVRLLALNGPSQCRRHFRSRWKLTLGRWTAIRVLIHMYGPAVRCKRVSSVWHGCAVLHQCIRLLIGAGCAPSHHGYQRACGLIKRPASIGPFGSPVFACAGKTDPPSRLILSQTSAGKSLALRH
jgi:hypothetical protein